uniref:O-antigen transporter n=1 Tax=Aggregatibacter actinomycetemcomitans TaxID=714 RepID=Q9JRS2_AGGAC|nr:O-antigen transporter [Aggregatibacter actinomycetemcomitans]
MIHIFKNLLESRDNRKLLENFISLFLLQGMNYILPLLLFPYLVRVLGVENFGILSFVTAVIAYFILFTDYGFNITATRDISINKDNNNKVSEIFSSVIIIKLLLGIFSFLVLYVLVYTVQGWKKYNYIYFLTFGSILGQILLPIWFYQGMEKMKFFAIFNVLARIISTILIFLYVKEPEDIYFVPLVNSIAMIISGGTSFLVIRTLFNIRFQIQRFEVLIYYFKNGWNVFLSMFFSNFYRNFNILVLGLLTNDLFVGYYAIAEKLIKIIQVSQDIVGNVLFPYFSEKFIKNNQYFFNFNNKFFPYIVSCYFILWFSTYFLSDQLAQLFNEDVNGSVSLDIKIMSIVILIGGLNYYFGILGLLSMGKNKYFSDCIIITGISNIFISFLFVYFWDDIGASFSLVASEFILLIMIKLKLNKVKLMYKL